MVTVFLEQRREFCRMLLLKPTTSEAQEFRGHKPMSSELKMSRFSGSSKLGFNSPAEAKMLRHENEHLNFKTETRPRRTVFE